MRALNRAGVSAAVIACWLALGSLAHASDRSFDKTFPATPGGTLTVETDTGSIRIAGADVHEVRVRATLSGAQSQLDDFETTATTDSRGVIVRGERRGSSWLDLSWLFGGGLRVRYDIQVPRQYHLDLRTAGGSIELASLQGDVHGRTSGGRLRLDDLRGSVIDVRTSGGAIQADRLQGNVVLRTSGGSVTVADVRGELDIHTSGGSMRLTDIDGRLDARTAGGSIDATLSGANRGVNLRTAGGSIRIAVPRDFKADVDARTSSGGVHSDLPIDSDRDDDRNSLVGDMNGGGPTLSARTSGGSIRLSARE